MHRKWLSLIFCAALVAAPGTGRAWQENRPAAQPAWVDLFRAGQRDMRAGRFKSAISNFSGVLKLRPGLLAAVVNLGLAYNAAGDYALAVSTLSHAARANPQVLAANLFLALSYMKLGDPGHAIPALDRALSIDPKNRQARRALAEAEAAEGHYHDAAVQFRALSASQTDKATALFELGNDYLGLAKRLTAGMTLKFGDSAWSLRLAGDVLGDRGLWSNAASAYGRALKAAPNEPSFHAVLGTALLHAGRLAGAQGEFAKALAADPSNFGALLGQAAVDLGHGDARAAAGDVNEVWARSPEFLAGELPSFPAGVSGSAAQKLAAQLAVMPHSPASEFLLVAVLRSSGNAAESRVEQTRFQESVRRAIASPPEAAGDAPSACVEHRESQCVRYLASRPQLSLAELSALGQALFTLRQNQAAAVAFSSVLSHQPDNPEAMYWLSRSFERLSDDCFNRLSAAYPGSWQAHELKGDALRARQRDAEAITEYHAAERLNPENTRIHLALAEVLLGQNATAEGKSELEAALRLDPASARGLYLLGNLYVYQHQPARAIPYLEAALKYDPNLAEARPALGQAYLRIGKPALAAAELQQSLANDRYGNLHYLLYEAYRQEGKTALAAGALAESQRLRRKSEAEDQAKLRGTNAE